MLSPVLCPAALTALALAAIVPRAFCFGRSVRDDSSGSPVVAFKVGDSLTCAGALVSSKDVLTTAACAEMLTNDGKAKALLGDKTASVLCHNTDSANALSLIRLGEPLCDADNPRAMFTPAQVVPTTAAAGCLMLYPKDVLGKITVLPEPVDILDCPTKGSKRSIETKGSEKVCATFANTADDVPLFGGLVLKCASEDSARAGLVFGRVIGLLPARKTKDEAPVLESAVNLDKDNKFWVLSGTADCTAPKSTPFPCDPTTPPTTKATPATVPTTTPTPATAATTGSTPASTATPASPGTQPPSPSGSPGLAPPAPLLAIAAARALTLLSPLAPLARRLA